MAKFFCPTKISGNISKTPEGYLLCLAVPIARTGVMEYGPEETPLEVGDDGLVYVSRTAEELFSKETIASFEGKSVTIRHPVDFVDTYNWKELTKGTMHNVQRGEELDENGEEVLLADVLITEAFAITLVENGLREVSCGYEAEYEQTGPGEGVQTEIRGNHLALVEEGRAGSTYAIRDHNRKVDMKDKLQKLLQLVSRGKTVDQAIAEMEKGSKKRVTGLERSKGVTENKAVRDAKRIIAEAQKVIDAAKKKSKGKDDGGQVAKKTAGSETNTVMDEESQKSYDAMQAACDALKGAMDAMKKPDDKESEDEPDEDSEEAGDEEEEESEDESDDDEATEESKDEDDSVESRLKALEQALTKLLESKAGDEAEEESEDEDSEEESEDEDLEGSDKKKTGDAARAEILSPGFEAPKKGNLRAAALKAAYATAEGKAVIHILTGGKKPAFDSKEKVSQLFIAASEVMKLKVGNGLGGTRSVDSKPITFDSFDSKSDEMTPEKQNEANAAFYAAKK